MKNTIETSCGDIVQISCIDAVGEVNPYTYTLPVYRKILFWNVHVFDKEENDGYEFMIHTIGGSYYWINRETEEEADDKRAELINIMGYKDDGISHYEWNTMSCSEKSKYFTKHEGIVKFID